MNLLQLILYRNKVKFCTVIVLLVPLINLYVTCSLAVCDHKKSTPIIAMTPHVIPRSFHRKIDTAKHRKYLSSTTNAAFCFFVISCNMNYINLTR